MTVAARRDIIVRMSDGMTATMRFEGAVSDGARRTFRFASYVRPEFIERALLVAFEDGRIVELYFSSNAYGTARWTEQSGLVDSHRWESEDEARSGSYLARRYPIILENGPVSDAYALRAIVPDVLDALVDRALAGYLMTLVSGFRIVDADDFETRQRRLDEECVAVQGPPAAIGGTLRPVPSMAVRDDGAGDVVTRPPSHMRESVPTAQTEADPIGQQEEPVGRPRHERPIDDAAISADAAWSGDALAVREGRMGSIDRLREFAAGVREFFFPAVRNNERSAGTDGGTARERMDDAARIAKRIKRR